MKNVKKILVCTLFLALSALFCGLGAAGISVSAGSSDEVNAEVRLNVGQDVAIIVDASVPENAENVKTTFAWTGKQEYSDTIAGVFGEDGKYTFTYRGLNAQNLLKTVNVGISYTLDGVENNVNKVFVAKDYLAKIKTEQGTLSDVAFEKLKILADDILVYGGAAQKYLGDTDALASEGITGSNLDLGDLNTTTSVSGDLGWKTGIRFDCGILPLTSFALPAGVVENDMKVKVSFGGVESAVIPEYDEETERYTVVFDGYDVLDYENEYTFTVENSGIEIGHLTYSLGALAKNAENKTDDKSQLIQKTYIYAQSVLTYAEYKDVPSIQIKMTDEAGKTYRTEAEDASFTKGTGDKEKYNVVDDANASGGKRLDGCDWLKDSSFTVYIEAEKSCVGSVVICCDGPGLAFNDITKMTFNGETVKLSENPSGGWTNFSAYACSENVVIKKGINKFVLTLTATSSVNYDYFEFAYNPLERIEVSGEYEKEYNEGETFDSTGMVVTAVYADGTKKTVTDYTIDGDTLTVGNNFVTVKYGDKSEKISLTVTRKSQLTSISATYEGGKTEYYAGQKFDKTNLVVTAVYDDGSTINVNDYVIENETLGLNDTSVTISWGGKTTVIPVTVKTHLTIENASGNAYRIEAEDALFTKGTGDKEKYDVVDDENASGGKRLNSCDWLQGSTFTITVNAKVTGKFKLSISCDGGGSGGNLSAFAKVTVNGTEVSFTPDLNGGWGNLQVITSGSTLDLAEGLNQIVITITGTGSVNYDYFELSVVEG